MKYLVIIVFALTLASFLTFQKKEYVCTPCGQDCDTEIHDKPGTCEHCGMGYVEKSSIKFSNLTFEQLCARLKANPKAVLLDVRSPAEFNGTTTDVPSFGHFKNAININIEELESRVAELAKYKNQEVLVYCSHSHRSPRASYFLTTHGFKDVKNMAGGVSTLSAAQSDECMKRIFVKHSH